MNIHPDPPNVLRRRMLAALAAVALACAGALVVGGNSHRRRCLPGRGGGRAPDVRRELPQRRVGPHARADQSLAGSWGFTPLTNTVCTGGGPFGTTAGPMTLHGLAGQRRDHDPGAGRRLAQAGLHRPVGRCTAAPSGAEHPGDAGHQARVRRDQPPRDARRSTARPSAPRPPRRRRRSSTSRRSSARAAATRSGHVKGRKALVGADGRYTVPEGASWSDDVAQGIFRSADLEVFPALYISDTFVRTSVADRTLSYDVYVANATARPQTVTLHRHARLLERRRLALPDAAER